MKIKLLIATMVIMLLSFGTAFGQDYMISLDSVAGFVSGTDSLATGVPVTFYLRLTNPDAPNVAKVPGYSTGFQLYSDDGATWEPITWVPYFTMTPFPHVEVFHPNWLQIYDFDLSMNPYGVSGEGADTIGFAGAQKYGGGIGPGFDDVTFTISTQISAGVTGTICLDSSWYPPENEWLWSSDTGVSGVSTGDIKPVWVGPYCYAITGTGAAVSERAPGLPETFALDQNYPNPFNPSTTINFDLPVRSQVTISIYNVLGQKVRNLVDEVLAPGHWTEEWNGTSDDGAKVASGIYFYRIAAGDFVQTKKMMLLK